MNTLPPLLRTGLGRRRRESAFTMVEIALSLAVIGFALVAILKVLPLGLTVQRENREETIINQDATYWIEAIRNGARGLDDLPLYVQGITNFFRDFDANGNPTPPMSSPPAQVGYTPLAGANNLRLDTGARIVGLLSTPKFEPLNRGAWRSNYVVAYVRSISGMVADKPPQSNSNVLDTAFSYRMTSELVPRGSVPAVLVGQIQVPASLLSSNLVHNLFDLRLTYEWPLFQNGRTGFGRQTFRTQLSGQLQSITDAGGKVQLYFLQPKIFTRPS
jgi:hypothetical protein